MDLVKELETIEFLSKLSLKELRKRQGLTDKQITIAYNQKNTQVLEKLQIRRQHLDCAIDLK